MAYSTNPNLPKARAIALKLLIRDGLPSSVVARKCGVHRSTIWRWKKKWDVLNRDVQLTNDNRPSRSHGKVFRQAALRWNIATISSKPHGCPHAIPKDLIELILCVRSKLRRCAEVIWHELAHAYNVWLSLSSVKRILRRHHCFDGARKPRVRPDNPRRPHPTRPGELIETDTIHHVDPKTGKRLYYYTVIDLYTRLAHVTVSTKLRPGLAAQAVLTARRQWGFTVSMAQTDNGPEYGYYFEQQMNRAGIQTRHTRLHRPNDNAHIERFNRTIQTECIGYYWKKSVPLSSQQDRLTAYLEYYNTKRVHLGLQLKTPAEMLQRC